MKVFLSPPPPPDKRGFSLVELSIVLVILGLLVGAILAGRSLIRAAELRAVTSEYQRYVAAIQTFRLKYGAIPGDMRNATFYWGQAMNCAFWLTFGQILSGGSCNGDGDTNNGELGEKLFAWHHLAKAGLIEGEYTGLSGSGHFYDDADAGVNVPQSKVSEHTGWCFGRSSYGGGWIFALDYRNMLTIGNTNGDAGDCQDSYPFIPEEAWDIDTKIDDGMPARGKVNASQITRCTNAWTGTTNYDAIYSLTGGFASLKECGLFFRNAF